MRHAALLAILCVGLTAFATSASGTGTPAWRMFQYNARHTGRSPFKGPGQVATAWSFRTDGQPGSPAIGADGTIYVPAGMLNKETSGYLYALNPNGTKKWQLQLPGPPSSTAPAIGADGTIYVHSNGRGGNVAAVEKLVAVNPNGTVKWKYSFNGGSAIVTSSVQSSPAVDSDGRIWVGSEDTGLYSFNPSGTVHCAVSPEFSSIDASPAIAPTGTVYISVFGWALYAFDRDCHFKWSYDLAPHTGGEGSPMVDGNGTVWIGSSDGHVTAIRANGTLKCRYLIQDGEAINSTPALAADGVIYVEADDEGLFALRPDCTKKWLFPRSLGGGGASPIVDYAGVVYWREAFTSYAVNPNGTKRWSIGVDPGDSAGLDPTPAIGADGRLYVPDGGFTGPNRVRALKTPS